MGKAVICCKQGLVMAGYAWSRAGHNRSRRYLLRYCMTCKTAHVNELHFIDPTFLFCLHCFSQLVSHFEDGAVLHLQCQECGKSTAVEMQDPEEPDLWHEHEDDADEGIF